MMPDSGPESNFRDLLPRQFLDELRVRAPLPQVIGKKAHLERSGRNWKGCCPFHDEKTPSFYVYDDHFHCYGCGAHGDAISFVLRADHIGFHEAVERLADEAGMDVPAASPEEVERSKRRRAHLAALAAAEKIFHRRLFQPEGRPALDYLHSRGISDETIRAFRIGWSGPGRGAVHSELRALGFDTMDIVDAGLARQTRGCLVSDFFFERVCVPVRDGRGRTVSFSARVLGDGEPKYINGPVTAVFRKRRALLGLDVARRGLAEGARLLVVEGAFDVLALHQSGFKGAVAPLGTALTEEHLQELWRLAEEPVLCFDADLAGNKAVKRVIALALPHLTPDRTLRVVRLTDGKDPDALLRKKGADFFRAILNAVPTCSASIFEAFRGGCPLDTPERRAAFRDRLDTAVRSMGHAALAAEFSAEWRPALRANAPAAASAEEKEAGEENAGEAAPRRRRGRPRRGPEVASDHAQVPTTAPRVLDGDEATALIAKTRDTFGLPTGGHEDAAFDFAVLENGAVVMTKREIRVVPRLGPMDEITPICLPIAVTAWLVRPDRTRWGKRLTVCSPSGPVTIDLWGDDLAQDDVLRRLLANRAGFHAFHEPQCFKMLRAWRPRHRILILSRPGVHVVPETEDGVVDGKVRRVYALLNGTVLNVPADVSVELESGMCIKDRVARGGSLAGWTAATEAALRLHLHHRREGDPTACVPPCDGLPHVILGIPLGLAAILLASTGLNAAVCLSGASTRGKTISVRAALSVFGLPTEEGLLTLAGGTQVGVRLLAPRRSGAICSLDETRTARSTQHLVDAIFGLAAGVDHVAGEGANGMRERATWQTLGYVTSEYTVRSMVEATGIQMPTGGSARLLDIDIGARIAECRKADIDAIKAAFEGNYGHAAEPFAKEVVARGYLHDPSALLGALNARVEILASGKAAHVGRAAVVLAAAQLALEIAQEIGLLSSNFVDEAENCIVWAMANVAEDAVCDAREAARDKILAWVAAGQGSYIQPREMTYDGFGRPVYSQSAQGYRDDAQDLLLVEQSVLAKVVGPGLTASTLGQALREWGWLAKTADEETPNGRTKMRYALKASIRGARPRCYHLRLAALGMDGQDKYDAETGEIPRAAPYAA